MRFTATLACFAVGFISVGSYALTAGDIEIAIASLVLARVSHHG